MSGVVSPGMRGAAAVASLVGGPEGDAGGVDQGVEVQRHFAQSQLLALIQADTAALGEKEGHVEAQGRRVLLGIPARGQPCHVMVAECPAGPAVVETGFHGGQGVMQVVGVVPFAQQVEGIAHVQPLAAPGVVGHHRQRIVVADLAHRSGAGVFVQQGAQALEKGQVLGLGLVVQMVLEGIGIVRADTHEAFLERLPWRVVAQLPVGAEIDGVETEAVHASIQPETHFAEDGLDDLGMAKVEIGLLGQEIVQVVLAAPGIPLPGRTAEDRLPVGGRRAIGARVGPDIPVGAWIVVMLTALDEPGMLVGSVRQHLVDDDLEPPGMGGLHQAVEVLESAEQRVDVPIVADVVAEVLHRRGEEGRMSPSTEYRERYFDFTWDAMVWNGETYGYPISVESLGLIYNKDIVQTAPESFEALAELDAELSEEGKKAILFDYGEPYYGWPLLAANGGYPYKRTAEGYDVGDIGVNNAGAVEGAQRLRELIDSGVLSEGTDYNVMASRFNRGEVATMISGPWAWSNLEKSGIDFGVAPLPKVGEKRAKPLFGVTAAMINAASPNDFLATEFLEGYLLDEEGLRTFNSDGSLGAVAHRAYQAELGENPNIAATLANAEIGDPMPNIPEMGAFWSAMEPALQNIGSGRQAPQAALDAAAERMRTSIQ